MTTRVQDDIEAIFADKAQDGPRFNEGRYPFTYAYDFFRGNLERFGSDNDEARGDRGMASREITAYCERTGQHRSEVIPALADAYLREHDIKATPEEKGAAMRVALRDCYRSLGFDAPVA